MFEKIRDFLPNTFRELIKYGLVGVLNASIYLGLDYLFVNNFEYFKQHLITSSLIAGTISFLNSLYFNRKWTFKSDTHWFRDSIYIFAIFAFSTFFQNSAYAALILYFKELTIYPESQYLFFSKLVGIVVFATLNFGLNKFVTFRKKKDKTSDQEIIN
jgi:putative flippase GtrA